MIRLQYYAREILAITIFSICVLAGILLMDTIQAPLAIIILVGSIFGILSMSIMLAYNYGVGPLCKERVLATVIDQCEIEVGESDFEKENVTISKVYYQWNGKTYRRIIETPGNSSDVLEINICKFFPRMIKVVN